MLYGNLLLKSIVPVTHWDTHVKHAIPFNLDVEDSLHTFKCALFAHFTEEITTASVRLYALPRNFKSYDERRHIETNEDFVQVVYQYQRLDETRPLLYAFNYENQSPNKPPFGFKPQNSEESSATNFTEESITCKMTANYTCLFCGMINAAGVGLMGCHIYERESYRLLKDKKTKIEKLDEFQISYIHQQNNLLCLCSVCHSKFDAYFICIHPVHHTLMISPLIREKLTGNGMFSSIHGKKIEFNGKQHRHPTLPLLQYRYNQFIDKHHKEQQKKYSKKNNVPLQYLFTCCICPELFVNEEKANEHMAGCSLSLNLVSSAVVQEE